MSKLTVGETSTDLTTLGRRDAFHVPGILVVSAKTIEAGESVAFLTPTEVLPCSKANRMGIADPFIPSPAVPGTMFWVLLCPELVSNLVHHFEVKGLEQPETVDETQKMVDKINDLQGEIARIKRENSKLQSIADRFDGYDDSDSECRGCY